MRRILLVVAMASEADVVAEIAHAEPARSIRGAEVAAGSIGDLDVVIARSDIGPVASAVTTTAVLARDDDFDAAISTGIAGAFTWSRLSVGDVIVADSISYADLGKEVPGGFDTAAALGWRDGRLECDRDAVAELAAATGATVGEIVTVTRLSTLPERIAELQANFPRAVGEAMEGIGVAVAARAHGVDALELRTISNLVGPPEECPWDTDTALDALAQALNSLGGVR